jgi:hypothetical protein
MKSVTKRLCATMSITLLLTAGACGKSDDKSEGPAEKAGATMGKAIDQATEKAGEAMGKAGEAMKAPGEKVKEDASEAIEKMKENKK